MNANNTKAVPLFVGLLALFSFQATAQVQTPSTTTISSLTASPDYVCVQRGPDSRVWQQSILVTNADGNVSTNYQSYTELATGLCFTNAAGQLVDSVEQVESVAGGAQAVQGQYSVQWGLDNGTPVAIQTPEGKTLTCQVFGLAYYDLSSGSNAAISRLQDSQGAIAPPNQVVYSQSFSNINADILYTYTSAGLSQDIVFHQAPLAPDAFGLSDSNTVLQVYTQWFNTGDPVATAVTNGNAVDDQVLSFGAMQMNVGNSLFFDGNSNQLSVSPVQKQWVHLNGSTYLVESIPWNAISNQMAQLHSASNLKPGRAVRGLALLDSGSDNNTKKTKGTKETAGKRPTMKVAKADSGGKRFVIDYYVALSSGSTVTLQGDTTYYVSSVVNVTSQLVVEGGAVVKYKNNSGEINVTGTGSNIVCLTSPYRMAVFTSMNDNSVGATISGSTGSPSQAGTYINLSLEGNQPLTLRYLRFDYASTAVAATVLTNSATTNWIKFMDCQFYDCGTAISCYSEITSTAIYAYNVLFSDVTYGIVAQSNSDLTVSAENVTADDMDYFAYSVSSVTAINCIFTDVTNPPGSSSMTECAVLSSGSTVYTTVGGGSYYLASGSTNRAAGTTSIDSNLLADLATLTTYAPTVVQTNITGNTILGTNGSVPRNNGTPDRGYHYFPIDWAINTTNSATLTISNGVAICAFGSGYGIDMTGSGNLQCQGTAVSPVIITRYNTIQEQSSTSWEASSTASIGSAQTSAQAGTLEFTEMTLMASDIHYFTSGSGVIFGLQNCQLYSGQLYANAGTVQSTNSLYWRVAAQLTDSSMFTSANTFANNLFCNGSMTVDHAGTSTWLFRDNLFDQCDIANTGSANIVCSSNAYATNLLSSPKYLPGDTQSTIVPLAASPAYQTGTLGQFYYPLNQTNLIFYGSQLASAAGLYHYTVTTNNAIDGTNMVSIGFHYVATDNNGNPLDTDGDGIPDYIKDANGDGVYDAGDLVNWQNPFNIYDQGSNYGGFRPANVRLGYWRFNNAISLANEHGDLPTANVATSVSTDWSGSSVGISRPGTNLQYLTEDSDGWTNFDTANGTVRFWFRPSWSSTNVGGTGPGQNAAFLDFVESSGFSWELYAAPNGQVLEFQCSSNFINGPDAGVDTSTSPGNWVCTFVKNQWYQIALTYSPSNIAAYVNGALIGTATWPAQYSSASPIFESSYGMFVWPTIGTTLSFAVGSDVYSQSPMNGEMDELETFNYPLSAQAIAYGFATFNGCSTNNTTDSDYVGRNDVLRTLVDGVTLPAPNNVTPCRLGYWRFDSPLWIGEQGQFPITAKNVTMGTGWSGGALNVGSAANSALTYPDIYTNGWANINCHQGTVRFWFEPNWNSGSAPSAPFISLGNGTTNVWTLELTGGIPQIQFLSTSNSAGGGLISAPLSIFASNQWCQIVLTYGSTGCALYTNGMLAVTNPTGVGDWPNSANRATGMIIGNNSAYNSPINGKFDELETFNYELSANQILTNFQTIWNIDNNLDGIPDIVQDTLLFSNTPFLGRPVVVTGTIEAEQFDRGGSNVAYVNLDPNPPSSYRTTGMCITNCSDLGGGYCLTQTRQNEWTKYSINVLVAQTYAIDTRVLGMGTGGWFELTFSNNSSGGVYASTGPLQITTTNWTDVIGYANLQAGTNIMTLKFLTNASSGYVGMFNYLTVYPWWQAGFTSTNMPVTVTGLSNNVNSWAAATNNTYRIQQALALVVANGGGTVLITNIGTNYVAQTNSNEGKDANQNAVLNIVNNNIAISGVGANTILKGYNRATSIIYLGADTLNDPFQCANFTLENITLEAQPHMAVNTNNPTQVIYQSGMFTNPVGSTGALVALRGQSAVAYANNILFTNCQFIDADRAIDLNIWTSNVLVQACSFIQFDGTNGIYVPGVYNPTIQYSAPDNYFMLGILGQAYNYNIGVVGCSYNGNPNFTNQITSNPNPTNYIANQSGGGNGLLLYQSGGNFFALRNFITNNAVEAIQFFTGPATVTGNTFWSWADNSSACALAPNMSPTIGPGATGYSFPNYSVTFVGNSVTGNSFGAVNDTTNSQGPYTLNFSGNSLSLFLPASDPVTNVTTDCSSVRVLNCQDLNVSGNIMTSGGTGIMFLGSCSNSLILANNFSGLTYIGVMDKRTGPENAQQMIGNSLGCGYGYHLKAIFQEGPNWFLYNNQYLDAHSNNISPLTDAASLWAHITP